MTTNVHGPLPRLVHVSASTRLAGSWPTARSRLAPPGPPPCRCTRGGTRSGRATTGRSGRRRQRCPTGRSATGLPPPCSDAAGGRGATCRRRGTPLRPSPVFANDSCTRPVTPSSTASACSSYGRARDGRTPACCVGIVCSDGAGTATCGSCSCAARRQVGDVAALRRQRRQRVAVGVGEVERRREVTGHGAPPRADVRLTHAETPFQEAQHRRVVEHLRVHPAAAAPRRHDEQRDPGPRPYTSPSGGGCSVLPGGLGCVNRSAATSHVASPAAEPSGFNDGAAGGGT